LEAGATAVGIGSNLITKGFIQKKDWEGLSKRIASSLKIAKMFHKT
jgi:2-keto-3-deoxy-6-phosphogluconate aldolase